MNENVEIRLQHPFTTAAGTAVDKVTVRTPLKVRDVRQAHRLVPNGTPEEIELACVAVAAGLVPEDLDEMAWTDLQRLQRCFQGAPAVDQAAAAGSPVTPGAGVPSAAERV